MPNENINGIVYKVRERSVNGKQQTIYYKDGEAYIKDSNGELQKLLTKTKGSIFKKAEYIVASEYDYDQNGLVTEQEQKKAYGQWIELFMMSTFGKDWADTFAYAKNSLNDIVSKYISGDLSANNEVDIENTKKKILDGEISIKEDLLNTMNQALNNKSAMRAYESIQNVTALCEEYKDNINTLSDEDKSQYLELAKKWKHLLGIEQKMHPQNKELNDSIQQAIDLIDQTFNLN